MSGEARRRDPGLVLATSFVVAVGLRIVHAVSTEVDLQPRADNTFFVAMARSVAEGDWGRLATMDGSSALSIKFPPLWPWTLGLGQRLLWFLPADTANATWSILIGSAAAPLAALLAWRLLDRLPNGRRRLLAGSTGLVTAAHPLLIGATNAFMSEVVVVPLSLGIVLVLNRVHRQGPRPGSLFLLGALIGLATLARPEALVLWGVAVAAAAVMLRSWRAALVPLATAAVPALAFSALTSAAADTPVFISTNSASAVAGANCEATWSGEAVGHWSRECLEQVWLGRVPPDDRTVIYAHERQPSDRFPLQLGPRLEGQLQGEHQRGALYAIRQEPAQFLRVVPVRIARGLGLWWSADQTRLEVSEGRVVGWEVVGRWAHIFVVLPAFVLTAGALAGRKGRLADMLDRCVDRGALLPLTGAFGIWLLGVMVTHGSTRHRAAVDALFLIGAAVGYAMVWMDRRPPPADASTSIDITESPGRSAHAPSPSTANGVLVGSDRRRSWRRRWRTTGLARVQR
ncbi:hypothetical protein BH23ACT2_BH23ACT2_25200 [soil metagenome]